MEPYDSLSGRVTCRAMSADQSDTEESNPKTFGGPVIAILIVFSLPGLFLTLLSSSGIGGPNFSWFWASANVGFAVSVLYLLTKIANGVYQRDLDH
jgi:hypothetical protein